MLGLTIIKIESHHHENASISGEFDHHLQHGCNLFFRCPVREETNTKLVLDSSISSKLFFLEVQ